MVFCVFNWHDELLRAQMDDDWTANIVCVCVVRVLSFFGGAITKTKPKPKQSTRAKKRDFSMTLVFGALGTAKRTLFDTGQAHQKRAKKYIDSSKNKTTQKHIHRERYDEKSSIDIPDDAFFERKTTEKNEEDEFDESVHELFFFGVKKDDDKD